MKEKEEKILLKGEKMKVTNPKIGQTVYTSKNCSVGRWVVDEIISRKTKNSEFIEYILMDGIGRKVKVQAGERILLDNLAEAVVLALQELQVLEKNIRTQLETMTDQSIDKAIKEQQKAVNEKNKKKK